MQTTEKTCETIKKADKKKYQINRYNEKNHSKIEN